MLQRFFPTVLSLPCVTLKARAPAEVLPLRPPLLLIFPRFLCHWMGFGVLIALAVPVVGRVSPGYSSLEA